MQSRGRKTFKKKILTTPTSPYVIRQGFKKNYPCSSKNKLQHIQFSDTTGTSSGTGLYGKLKMKTKKLAFLTANTQDGFGQHRDKTHVYNEIFYCIFNVVGLYFCWRSWTSFWIHDIMDSIEYQQIKKISDWLC